MKRTLISTAVIMALGSSINAEANTAGLTGIWTGTYVFTMRSPFGGPVGVGGATTPPAWTWDFDAGTIVIENLVTFKGSVWTAHDVTFDDKGTYYGTDDTTANGGAVNMLFDWSINTNIPSTAGWDVTASGNTVSDTATVSVAFSTITADAGAFPEFHLNFNGTLHKTANTVPVPAAAWLMGSGLIGLIGFARRKT